MSADRLPPSPSTDEKRRRAATTCVPKLPRPAKSKEHKIPKGRIRQGRSRS